MSLELIALIQEIEYKRELQRHNVRGCDPIIVETIARLANVV
jgi:hypothetical protein